ncbi:MAG TPA: pilus assembly protein N-terminal domain-containing protein [Xanthobacteraceae bacterium]|nr:pilus assembly protein N-terminal domain-containing protein [Xanthobacteraceae bacterium]
MTALWVRGRESRRPRRWLAAGLLAAAVAAPAAAAEPIPVRLDQARILKLPDRATTVVIGNPLIADLSLEPGGIAVITGKGFGATNVVVMDGSGTVLMERWIEVQGPSDPIVVVYRGMTRQTYSCTPECSPRIMLGDSGKDFFDKETNLETDPFKKALDQATTRNAQAAAAGALSGH